MTELLNTTWPQDPLTMLVAWLFTPLPGGLIIAAAIRLLLGFSTLVLSERYRRDGDYRRSALALALGGWTLLGGVSVEQNPNAPVTPYALIWLLLIYALFVSTIIQRAQDSQQGGPHA